MTRAWQTTQIISITSSICLAEGRVFESHREGQASGHDQRSQGTAGRQAGTDNWIYTKRCTLHDIWNGRTHTDTVWHTLCTMYTHGIYHIWRIHCMMYTVCISNCVTNTHNDVHCIYIINCVTYTLYVWQCCMQCVFNKRANTLRGDGVKHSTSPIVARKDNFFCFCTTHHTQSEGRACRLTTCNTCKSAGSSRAIWAKTIHVWHHKRHHKCPTQAPWRADTTGLFPLAAGCSWIYPACVWVDTPTLWRH